MDLNCIIWHTYAMPPLEDIIIVLGHAKVFSKLNLHFGYHELPLKEGYKAKMTFKGIDLNGKDCLYQWWFLPFGLNNAFVKFQRVMD